MNMYVGVTDRSWYEIVSKGNFDEVNFWKPSPSAFKALQPNDLFLFKLHAPDNYIVGGGFFVEYSCIPSYLAWQAFGKKNGAGSLQDKWSLDEVSPETWNRRK